MNIKKIFTHHHSSLNVSHPDTAWKRIVYAGFVLVAISIIFHIWLFFFVGKTSSIPSMAVSATSEAIDTVALDNLLSSYAYSQSEKASQSHIDTALIDPSK